MDSQGLALIGSSLPLTSSFFHGFRGRPSQQRASAAACRECKGKGAKLDGPTPSLNTPYEGSYRPTGHVYSSSKWPILKGY